MRRRGRSVRRAPEWFRAIGWLVGGVVRSLLLAAPFLPFLLGTPAPVSILGMPHTVLGCVHDALTDRSIAGARVYAEGDGWCFETRTVADGGYRLLLPSLGSGEEPEEVWEDPYEVQVEADGYVPIRAGVVRPHPDRYPVSMNFTYLLPVAARVRVRAIDAEGGTVRFCGGMLRDEPWRLNRWWLEDPDVVREVGPGQVAAEVWTDDGRWGRATAFVAPGPVRDREIEVPVVPGHVVSGTLLDEEKRPISGCTVWVFRRPPGTDRYPPAIGSLSASARDRVDRNLYTAESGADGGFRVVTPPEGECLMAIARPGLDTPFRGWSSLWEVRGTHLTIEIPIPRPIRGRLLNIDGTPARGLRIESQPDPAGNPNFDVTDDEGRFEVRSIYPPPYVYEFRVHDRGRPVGRFPYTSREGHEDEELEFRLRPLRRVSGTVRDAISGRPVPDVLLSDYGTFTDPRGGFTIEVVPEPVSGEVYRSVSWIRAGYEPLHDASRRRIPAGEHQVVELRPRAALRVKIRDANGPVAGCAVERYYQFVSGWTDKDGIARFREEPGRVHELILETRDGRSAVFEVEPGWQPRMLLEELGLLDEPDDRRVMAERGRVTNLGTYRLDGKANKLAQRSAAGQAVVTVRNARGERVPHAFLFECPGGSLWAIGGPDGRILTWGDAFGSGLQWHVVTARGHTAIPVVFLPGGRLNVTLTESPVTRGVLVDAAGRPRVGVRLFAASGSADIRKTPPDFLTPPSVTDTRGRFVLTGLPADRPASVWESRDKDKEIHLVGEIRGGQQDGRIATRE